jgi:hypothetical protein
VDTIGHGLNVSEGSCQVIGRWHKSCCGVEERRTTKQISDKGGWIFGFLKVFRKVSQKL